MKKEMKEHYLIRMIDRVLKATDNSTKGECVAVLATLVDWKKAYPMLDQTLGIVSFIKNGVGASLNPDHFHCLLPGEQEDEFQVAYCWVSL